MPEPKRISKQNRYGDGKRFYLVGDLELPSVTSILSVIGKPALINWAAKVERELTLETSADLYLDCAGCPAMSRVAWITTMQARLGKEKASKRELVKASEIGSQAHALIEWNLRARLCQKPGPPPHITDKAQWAFQAWEKWAESVNLKPLLIEQTVYSTQYGYAGTLDLLAEVDGKLTVLDWKTGKAIYSEAVLQNVAYRQALREMGHGDAVQGIIVRLPKVETDPDFEAKVLDEPEEPLFQVFLHAMQLWTWQQKMEAEREAHAVAKESADPSEGPSNVVAA